MGIYDKYYWRGVLLSTILFTLPALSAGLAWMFCLAPLPLIYFPIAHGLEKGLKIILHALLLSGGIALIVGTLPVMLLSAGMLPSGYLLLRGLSQREPFLDSFTKGTVALLASWLGFGLLLGIATQANLYREIQTQIDQGLAMASEAYSTSPDLPLDIQAEVQATFTRIREVVPKIFPGLVAAGALGIVWLNAMLADWLLRKRGLAGWEGGEDWRLPYALVWVFIVAGSSLFLPGALHLLGMNLMLVTVTLYCMQGFAVLNHLCLRWSVPPPMRGLIVFFLVIQAYGFLLLALLGLADVWADFRTPRAQDES